MSPPLQDPQRLRRRRIEAGLNQGELASRAGISESYMSLLSRGKASASPRVLKRLAGALSCEIADLMPPQHDDAEAGAA
jgi:transcriptional regulator with XRE-family HTH domain